MRQAASCGRSYQFGRASAPIVPHFAHAMRGLRHLVGEAWQVRHEGWRTAPHIVNLIEARTPTREHKGAISSSHYTENGSVSTPRRKCRCSAAGARSLTEIFCRQGSLRDLLWNVGAKERDALGCHLWYFHPASRMDYRFVEETDQNRPHRRAPHEALRLIPREAWESRGGRRPARWRRAWWGRPPRRGRARESGPQIGRAGRPSGVGRHKRRPRSTLAPAAPVVGEPAPLGGCLRWRRGCRGAPRLPGSPPAGVRLFSDRSADAVSSPA
jgi:hypothetical protein